MRWSHLINSLEKAATAEVLPKNCVIYSAISALDPTVIKNRIKFKSSSPFRNSLSFERHQSANSGDREFSASLVSRVGPETYKITWSHSHSHSLKINGICSRVQSNKLQRSSKPNSLKNGKPSEFTSLCCPKAEIQVRFASQAKPIYNYFNMLWQGGHKIRIQIECDVCMRKMRLF